MADKFDWHLWLRMYAADPAKHVDEYQRFCSPLTNGKDDLAVRFLFDEGE